MNIPQELLRDYKECDAQDWDKFLRAEEGDFPLSTQEIAGMDSKALKEVAERLNRARHRSWNLLRVEARQWELVCKEWNRRAS